MLAAIALSACGGVYQPMGPALGPPALENGHSAADMAIVAADGYRLPLRRWLPEDPPRAVLVALHGFNDYSNAFADVGPVLAQRGVATYAYDQRGFGGTERPGIWAGSETLIADLAAAVRLARDDHPDAPVYLLGESMGGAVVMAALAADGDAAPNDVAGAVLVAPAVWGRQAMAFPERAALWFFAAVAPGMEFTGEGLDIQASDNIEMLRAFSRDPLVLKRNRVDTIAGLVDLMDLALEAPPDLHVPLLVLYGDNEEIIPDSAVDALLAALPGNRSVVAFYADGWHMLLRDLNGPVVVEDIAAWLADPDSPLPSGADRRRRGDPPGPTVGAGT